MAIRKIVSRSITDGVISTSDLAAGSLSSAGLDITGVGGTGAALLPKGTTGQRPASPVEGYIRYNTTIGLYEQYTATGWQAVDAPPTVSNISGTINENTNSTLTITGTGFKSGSVVSIEGAGVGGTPRTLTTTFVSSTSLTAATNATSVNYTGGASFDLKVTNTSGLTGTLVTAGTVDRDPIWSTSAGTVATINDVYGSYSPIVTLSASDPEGTSVTYGIASGSLPGNVTLNSSTGAISGDPDNETSASTTYSFVASATSNTQVATRSFNIIVNRAADGSSSARAAASASAIKTLTGTTTDGLYWITAGGITQQIYCDMSTGTAPWMLVASNYFNDSTIPAGSGRNSTSYELDRSGVLGTADPHYDYIIGSIINSLPWSSARVYGFGWANLSTSRTYKSSPGNWIEAIWNVSGSGSSRLTTVQTRNNVAITGTTGLPNGAAYFVVDGNKTDRLNGGYSANANQITIGGVGVTDATGDGTGGNYLGHGANEGSGSYEGWYNSSEQSGDAAGYTTWVK